MVTPTPVLAPSPMDISALFSGAFTALRRRFGLFILLTLLPGLVTMLLVGIGIFLLVAGGLIVNHAPCGNWKRIDWDRLAA